MASPENDVAIPDALRAFAEGRMDRQRAVAALGLHDYAQLLILLGEAGLRPPLLPEAEVAAMQRKFVRLLRETWRP